MQNVTEHPYASLTPDTILAAIDSSGYRTNGSLLALNSYENRVYQVGLEDETFLVAKFYRPGRWQRAAILEEHAFARQLADEEIPVIAPLGNDAGETLFEYQGFLFALFPRRGGRAPELDDADHLRWLGRFLGRIHVVGASQTFSHRPILSPQYLGHDANDYLLESGFIAAELEHNYRLAADTLLQQVDAAFETLGPYRRLRLHGDCHPGNILWTDAGPHFVDLDDCMSGPALQDLWMLLSGNDDDMIRQMHHILEGYEQFTLFDPTELIILEALRALRIIHYSAWLARRWDDPAFGQAFPWFNTPRYWEDQLLALREQSERMDKPVLKI